MKDDRTEEIRRIEGLAANAPGDRFTIRIPVRCRPGEAEIVLSRIRQVLKVVVAQPAGHSWPGLDEWANLLPEWFVAKCAKERSPEEAERWLVWWRSLPAEEQAAAVAETPWALADWLHWFEPGPDQRQWSWWKGEVESEDKLAVVLAVDSWPVAHGAFDWIVRAAGATPLEEAPLLR